MSYMFGSENFVKTYIFGSSFLPVQVYIFGFSLGWKLIFLINLAYNKEKLIEKIYMDIFQGHVVFHIEMYRVSQINVNNFDDLSLIIEKSEISEWYIRSKDKP